jgi:hypothetical protein
MGHTSEHDAQARRKRFTILFLTITPDDKCSFRVRLYAEPDKEVNTQKLCPKNKFSYHTHIPNTLDFPSYTQHKLPDITDPESCKKDKEYRH